MNCTRCPLHLTRTNVVTGEGNCFNKIMVIGEAPGEDEDVQARPFVGRAGRVLRASLVETGLEPIQCRITNVVKCRPPENRRPKPVEKTACRVHLLDEIETYQPEVIVTVGHTAAQALLDTKEKMETLIERTGDNGIPCTFGSRTIPVIPVYHTSPLCTNRNKEALPQIHKGIRMAVKLAEKG